jgi:hypothetical protein
VCELSKKLMKVWMELNSYIKKGYVEILPRVLKLKYVEIVELKSFIKKQYVEIQKYQEYIAKKDKI